MSTRTANKAPVTHVLSKMSQLELDSKRKPYEPDASDEQYTEYMRKVVTMFRARHK